MVRAISATTRIAAIALLLAHAGCGGPNRRGAEPPDTSGRPTNDSSDPRVDAGVARAVVDSGSSATGPRLPKPLTELECDRFVDHVVTLVAAERARAADVAHRSDDANTPEEVRSTQQKLKTSMRASCLEVDRGVFNCAIAADSVKSLAQCDPESAAP